MCYNGFYSKDQFKYMRFKDGRYRYKNTGSSHLNKVYQALVLALLRGKSHQGLPVDWLDPSLFSIFEKHSCTMLKSYP